MYSAENLTQEALVLKLSNKIQNIDFEEMNHIFNISKFNFESEKTYILKLSEQIQTINFEEIKKNTEDTLLSLKSKQKNNIFEDLINKFGIGTQEGLGLMELAEALLRVPDKCTLYELLFDKISYKKNWKKYKNKDNGFLPSFKLFFTFITHLSYFFICDFDHSLLSVVPNSSPS